MSGSKTPSEHLHPLRRTGRRLLLAACVLAVLLIPAAQATPGAPDPSFNGPGKVTTAIGSGNDEAHALARQPDGKLVAAGYSHNGANNDFALARYNPNGSLDTSFNGSGKVTTGIGSGDDEAWALVLQPDGKLVAAGGSYNGSQEDFAVARFLNSSTLTVAKSGSGSGSVSSSPGGISCGSTARRPSQPSRSRSPPPPRQARPSSAGRAPARAPDPAP
jgi:uncharacterized delta-60 repeat protein